MNTDELAERLYQAFRLAHRKAGCEIEEGWEDLDDFERAGVAGGRERHHVSDRVREVQPRGGVT